MTSKLEKEKSAMTLERRAAVKAKAASRRAATSAVLTELEARKVRGAWEHLSTITFVKNN